MGNRVMRLLCGLMMEPTLNPPYKLLVASDAKPEMCKCLLGRAMAKSKALAGAEGSQCD